LFQDVPQTAKKLMAAFWPGALTIVLQASDEISPLLTAGSGKIGLRVSSHPIALKSFKNLKDLLPLQAPTCPVRLNARGLPKLPNNRRQTRRYR